MPLPPRYRVFITQPGLVWGSVGPHYDTQEPAADHAYSLNRRRTTQMMDRGIEFVARDWYDPANLYLDGDENILAAVTNRITPPPERWKVIMMIGDYPKATINAYLTELEARCRVNDLTPARPFWAIGKNITFRYEERDWPLGVQWFYGPDETLWQWIQGAVWDRERGIGDY